MEKRRQQNIFILSKNNTLTHYILHQIANGKSFVQIKKLKGNRYMK